MFVIEHYTMLEWKIPDKNAHFMLQNRVNWQYCAFDNYSAENSHKYRQIIEIHTLMKTLQKFYMADNAALQRDFILFVSCPKRRTDYKGKRARRTGRQ